jgi:hypothetical protein
VVRRAASELRVEFLAAFDEAMERLVRLAQHLGPAPGVDPALSVKRVFVKRFPFSLSSSSYPRGTACSPSPTRDVDRSTGPTVAECDVALVPTPHGIGADQWPDF